MPLTLATGAALVGSVEFQNRVAMAFYFAARQVLAENTDVTGHEVRANFARSITLQPLAEFNRYAAMVATHKPIVADGPYLKANGDLDQSKVTDQAILDAVTGMWDWLAGVPGTS